MIWQMRHAAALDCMRKPICCIARLMPKAPVQMPYSTDIILPQLKQASISLVTAPQHTYSYKSIMEKEPTEKPKAEMP